MRFLVFDFGVYAMPGTNIAYLGATGSYFPMFSLRMLLFNAYLPLLLLRHVPCCDRARCYETSVPKIGHGAMK
eukprot:1086859-Rhodomonas_salina.3